MIFCDEVNMFGAVIGGIFTIVVVDDDGIMVVGTDKGISVFRFEVDDGGIGIERFFVIVVGFVVCCKVGIACSGTKGTRIPVVIIAIPIKKIY